MHPNTCDAHLPYADTGIPFPYDLRRDELPPQINGNLSVLEGESNRIWVKNNWSMPTHGAAHATTHGIGDGFCYSETDLERAIRLPDDLTRGNFLTVTRLPVTQEPYTGGPGAADNWPEKGDVYFNTSPEDGISLSLALADQCDHLWKRDEPVFNGDDTSIATKIGLRIRISGYNAHFRQVMARRSTRRAEPVSRAKMAKIVAQEMQTVLGQSMQLVMNGRTYPFSQIFLWKLRHVSKGSWQPEFYVLL
ncbi:hypothetical protein C8Q78DRAFT_132328 [Trametes maxima]|nr:hypothetical protein C8Q78DRAFT_132328 [Trametes maxima]